MNTDMQIVADDGRIHFLFSREEDGRRVPAFVDNHIITAEQGLLASQILADLAFEADSGLKPLGPAQKAALVEKHRAVLLPRLRTMLNSLRDKRKIDNEQLAAQILDAVCAEVFS